MAPANAIDNSRRARYTLPMSIHDSGYKRLFSNRTIFQQLIQTFVDEPWVADLDFSQAETLDKSFVNEAYQAYESDLIYRVKLHGRDLYIYVLLEFQSTVDRFMALRVLNYVTQFYLELVASRQHLEKLPAVFPIVLYNGDRAWRAATRMSELIELEPSLGRYALGFEYLCWRSSRCRASSCCGFATSSRRSFWPRRTTTWNC